MGLFGLSHEFKKELYYVKDKNYKKAMLKLLDGLPGYFYVIGESFNNPYVAEYSKGRCGKIKETKVSTRIAYELLSDPVIGSDYSKKEKDLILMSIILHDGLERGRLGVDAVVFEHPILISEYIKYANVGLTLEDRDFLCSMVEAHSGIDNHHDRNDRVLPLPQSKYQKFVYMCIKMGNMKFFDIKFNANNEIEK